ncbi:MAG: hypothetical protein JXJ04_26080 [Spirochaetales bacterium]|nr:hypothetical protein [Spirochaetales bacterium]
MDKVAFIPFESSLATGAELAEKARITLALAMKEREVFSPSRLDIWLSDKYADEKAGNIDEIIDTMKKVKFDVSFICHGSMFKIGNMYGLKIALYPFDDSMSASHYIRYFELPKANPDKIEKKLKEISNDIIDEIIVRARMPKKFHFNKTIYIEKLGIKLIQISEIQATKTKVPTILPIITLDGIEYKGTDHFFHEILLYRLHASGLFSLKNNSMSNYIMENPKVPQDADYVVSGNLFIMDNLNILMIDVKQTKTNELVQSYMFPFTELTLDSLEAAMSRNALLIGLSVLNLQERERIGTADILVKAPDQKIYCNNYFLGTRDQKDIILPFGQNDVTIKDKMYKMFVYPFTKNYQLWELEDSIVTQILSIVENEKK